MHYMMHFVYFPHENGPRKKAYEVEPNVPAQQASGLNIIIGNNYDETHFYDNGFLANEKAELYYTNNAPAAGSSHLTIEDIEKSSETKGGKTTQKKHRKNKKLNQK